MSRHAFRQRIREGFEEEYRRVHDEVHPELVAAMTSAEVQKYTIFVDGRDVVHYFEVNDFDTMAQTMMTHPAEIAWQEATGHLLEPIGDQPLVFMEEIWQLP